MPPTASTLTVINLKRQIETFIVTMNSTTTDQATIKIQQRSCSTRGTAIKPMAISCGTIIAMGLRAVTTRLTQKSTTTRCTTITGADVDMAVSSGELAVAQLSKITSCTTTAVPTLPILPACKRPH